MNMKFLTDAQLKQIDFINEIAYDAISKLVGYNPPWNIEWIGKLSEELASIAVEYFNKDEMKTYPYIDIR